MNRLIVLFALMIPLGAFAQKSIFDNSEASAGSIRNLSQFASTDENAVIYNPAGLSFSKKAFQISIGGIGGYQQIENKPFALSDSGESISEMSHRSSIIRFTPSVQTSYAFGSWVLSLSYANEGGGGVWYDLYGNEIMDGYFRVYESTMSQWPSLQNPAYLLEDEETLDLYSDHFESKYFNRCIRIGASYRIVRHFSGYLGVKANQIGTNDECEGHLYVHNTSRHQRWLLSEYLMSTYGLLNNEINDSVYQQIDCLIEANSKGNRRAYSFSPMIGFDFNDDNFNVGLKFEMSPSIINENEKVIIPTDLSLGVSYLCSNDKLVLSAGADLMWGFRNGTMIHIGNEVNVIYNIVVGADYRINNNLLTSVSASFGNTCYSLRSTGRYIEVPVKIESSPARFSLGIQYGIDKDVVLDFGCSMNPLYGVEILVNSNNNFVANNVQFESHCIYRFMPRFAMGLGLTYSFKK